MSSLLEIAIGGLLFALFAPALAASSFDNEAGQYLLTALPDAAQEARRMDSMQLCDQQPAGRHVREGEEISITVAPLPRGQRLHAQVGFKPMWGSDQGQQEVPLRVGTNELTADQDGPLFFKLSTPPGQLANNATVAVSVDGGEPLPLFVDGEMSNREWRAELSAHRDAPFVQLVGAHALITLPHSVHAQQPISDPRATFATIDKMLELQNELSGFDGSTTRDLPTPLRIHYLVDFRVSEQDRQTFYMYATDGFVGMLSDNTTDLTDPQTLQREWGIWHETGHLHQQNSWTPDAFAEVNVNLYSLYVQESFGRPSALRVSEDGAPSFLARARDYLDAGADDLLAELDESDDGDGFFIRLVLFHQLQEVYGWDLFKDLNRHFRAHPLPEDATDQDKADAMVLALCELTGVDLRSFFKRWGLRISPAANSALDRDGYPPPDRDFSEIFD